MCKPAHNGIAMAARQLTGLFRNLTGLLSSPATHHSSRLTSHHSALPEMLIAGRKLLEIGLTHSQQKRKHFLIAGARPTFFSPAAPRISNRYTKLLEIELTRSKQTRKHFLIATICPTFASAPLLAHHLSLVTHHSSLPHLFPIRYKFALHATSLPAEGVRDC